MTAARREQLLSYAVLGVFCVVAIYPILSILLLALHERSDLVTGFSLPDSLEPRQRSATRGRRATSVAG